METKICTKCKRELPATNKYYSKNKRSKDNLLYKCKECDKKNYQENRERKIEYARQYRRENKNTIAEKAKEYYQKNKDKLTEYKKIYYQENKSHLLEMFKLYRNDNKEAITEYKKKWASENSDRLRERRHENREERSRSYKVWSANNKDKIRRNGQKRRAKIRNLPHSLTLDQWGSIKKYFNYECAYCGKKKDIEQEHFIPLTSGGEYTHNNIVPACKSCNSSKGNKSFFEWYVKHRYYSKRREKRILNYLNYNEEFQQLALL